MQTPGGEVSVTVPAMGQRVQNGVPETERQLRQRSLMRDDQSQELEYDC